MKYLPLSVIPGIAATFSFEVVDGDGLKVDVGSSTFRLELVDSSDKVVEFSSLTSSPELGVVEVILTQEKTSKLKKDLYSYRLFRTAPTGQVTLEFKGFLDCISPGYTTSIEALGTTTLPDGTIYSSTEIEIEPDTWYALASYSRFLITGLTTIVLDGRDIHGVIHHNLVVYQNYAPSTREWKPQVPGMTAFRLNVLWGTPQIKYLP